VLPKKTDNLSMTSIWEEDPNLETKKYIVQVAVTYHLLLEADNAEQAEEIATYDYADDPVAVVIDSIDVYEQTTGKEGSN
jgi:hypothetical protein